MKVITNRNRNVAILAKQTESYIHLITITALGLEARKITEEELTEDWSELVDYPHDKALVRFSEIGATLGTTIAADTLLSGLQVF